MILHSLTRKPREEKPLLPETLIITLTCSLPDLAKAFVSLFVVVDPLGNIPIFLGLTESMSVEERHHTFHVALITGFILMIFFAAVGHYILLLFGISIESFMIAGGILLLIISLQLLLAGWRKEESLPAESVGVVPIACPLLVGPGAITTVIMYFQTSGILVSIIAVILVFALTWLILRFIDPVNRLLGKTGSLVVSRVMALFIAAIAIEFILTGVTRIFHHSFS
ncbi:MAG: MarC family protein [Candidatus Freyarchaeota archaeon]|nr:MarC family protein [Candidatus Freyrarchaeum guaymaensis]